MSISYTYLWHVSPGVVLTHFAGNPKTYSLGKIVDGKMIVVSTVTSDLPSTPTTTPSLSPEVATAFSKQLINLKSPDFYT